MTSYTSKRKNNSAINKNIPVIAQTVHAMNKNSDNL